MSAKKVENWIQGREYGNESGKYLEKFNPHTGKIDSLFPDSVDEEVARAVAAAAAGFQNWSELTPVNRGKLLQRFADLMRQHSKELEETVARETGKPPGDAKGEVNAAIAQADFFAGEGMRLYGRSLTSGVEGKQTFTVRKPRGIAALIVPANTPIANIAWKLFPALICGNSVVLKSSEDAPEIALMMGKLSKEAGIPDGVVNVVHGSGSLTGRSLVLHPQIALISFTGSTEAGRWIAKHTGDRLIRVSLELGGKNAFVVCDDADIPEAVHWAALSAFSNAGQRCAAGSRILIFDNIFDQFVEKLVAKANSLKLGITEGCSLGPLINRRQQQKVLSAVEAVTATGGKVLCGGSAPTDADLAAGYYVQPTLVGSLPAEAAIHSEEVFGPLAVIQKISNLQEAVAETNRTPYGLTAAIHTRSIDRGTWFAHQARTGVVNINFGTFGSEPHMPFGGFGASGNGTREPGVEALDVYSELRNISVLMRKHLL